MIFLLKIVITISLLTITKQSAANDFAAHIHGHAELTIVIEQNNVELNLIVPAESLFGFEHVAKTPNEKSKVVETKKHLSKPFNIINFDSVDCQVKRVYVDTSDVIRNENHQHVHTHSHREVRGNYQFSCRNTNEILSATTPLFEHFGTLQMINVIWISDVQQNAIKLDANNTEITFH